MNTLGLMAPDNEAILGCAEACFAALPEHMRKAAGDVRIIVEDYATDDILDELGITDPLDLTGLYSGTPLTAESLTDPSIERPRVHLYRMPILFEWAMRGDTTIEEMVAHVFIHELGHHFGWSDDEIDRALGEG